MRIAILCPGRGAYTERTLRSLPEGPHPWVARAEDLRASYGLPPLVELDRAERFRPALHLRPANVAPLIWLVTMLDAAAARAEHELVCVAGNSMGWYTALAVSGALSFEDGFALVQEMALLQEEHAGGGQVVYPLVGENWRRDPAREAAVERALAGSGEVFRSIELGGYAVLAGSDAGLAQLLRALPQTKLGSNTYPLRLVQHGPYHTPLAAGVAERARETMARLRFRAPDVALVDGRGARWSPWSADGGELARYTLGEQVVAPFDFTRCVRVVLREHAPERLFLPGPGNSLGGVCGQVLALEGWRGIRSRVEFEAVQGSAEPVVVSMRG
jgi:[acyl-carrier-protein] S-malonyltransferase